MPPDLDAIRALATSCDHRHGSALLLACDEIAALRATLARMSTPTLTEFAAIATAALRDSSSAWNGMAETEKAAIKARVRYGLDYLASSHGVEPGDIYSAGPGDPPPTQPAT